MDEVMIGALVLGVVVVVVVGYLVVRWLRSTNFGMGSDEEPRNLAGVLSRDEEADIEYTGHFRPLKTGKNGHPAQLTVSLSFEISGEFVLVRESQFDRFCKRIGLASEVNTGEKAFDDMIYIQTDNPEYARRYFADPEKRLAVMRLFDYGFTQIEHDGSTLTATWLAFPKTADESEEHAEEAAQTLLPLRENLPPKSTVKPRRRTLSRKWLPWMSGIGIGIAVALGIALGIVMSTNAFPIRHWPLIGISFAMAAGAWLVFAWCSAWLVRGHSTSHLQFFSLALGAALSFPSLAILSTVVLNRCLDSSSPMERVETITGKEIRKSKNSKTHCLKIACWSEPGRTMELRTDATTFGRVQEGQTKLRLVTYPGRFGFEWIESFTVVDNPPKGPVP